MKGRILFHGGVPGLWCGDEILPDMAEHRYVEGCAHCDTQKEGGATLIDPATPSGWVYASRAVRGTLYRVRLVGNVEPSMEDPFPTWRAERAVVVGVPERDITLTMAERRRLFVRWGGSEEEFGEMIAGLGLRPPRIPTRRPA